MHQDLLVVFSP